MIRRSILSRPSAPMAPARRRLLLWLAASTPANSVPVAEHTIKALRTTLDGRVVAQSSDSGAREPVVLVELQRASSEPSPAAGAAVDAGSVWAGATAQLMSQPSTHSGGSAVATTSVAVGTVPSATASSASAFASSAPPPPAAMAIPAESVALNLAAATSGHAAAAMRPAGGAAGGMAAPGATFRVLPVTQRAIDSGAGSSGTVVNGALVNGAAVNGIVVNGEAVNGAVENGAQLNVAAGGEAPLRVGSLGLAAAGQSPAAVAAPGAAAFEAAGQAPQAVVGAAAAAERPGTALGPSTAAEAVPPIGTALGLPGPSTAAEAVPPLGTALGLPGPSTAAEAVPPLGTALGLPGPSTAVDAARAAARAVAEAHETALAAAHAAGLSDDLAPHLDLAPNLDRVPGLVPASAIPVRVANDGHGGFVQPPAQEHGGPGAAGRGHVPLSVGQGDTTGAAASAATAAGNTSAAAPVPAVGGGGGVGGGSSIGGVTGVGGSSEVGGSEVGGVAGVRVGGASAPAMARPHVTVWREEPLAGTLSGGPGSHLLLLLAWLLSPVGGVLLFCFLPPRLTRSLFAKDTALPVSRPLLAPDPEVRKIRSGDVSDDDSCDSSSPSSLHLDRAIGISLNLNPALPTPAARSRPNALCARAPDASGGPHPPAEPLPLPLLFLVFPAAGRYLPRWARALAGPARGELAGGGTSPDHAPLLGGVGGSGGSNASAWPAARACGDGDLLSPSIIGRWRRRHVSCEMRSPVAMSMLPPLHGSHGDRCLLSPAQRSRLVGHLPASISLCDWELLYSTEQNGCSLRNAYHRLASRGPTVLLVLDASGHVFGGYASSSWHISSHYFGTGESFLFSIHPNFRAFHWSGANSHFLLGAPDSLGFGGGGNFGLWLDESFEYGSSGRSHTFDNEPLASSLDFRVVAVEIWGFHHDHPTTPRTDEPETPTPSVLTAAGRTFSRNLDLSQSMLSRARGAAR